MSILHDIAKYGKIGDQGDLIEWLNSSDSKEFLSRKDIPKFAQPYEILLTLQIANKELRKPLVLSDFVRPEQPSYDQIFTDENSDTINLKHNEEVFKKDLEAWKNWTPLFDGWKETKITQCIVLEHDKSETRIDVYPDNTWMIWLANVAGASILKNPTKEEHIRLCKSHNINLIDSNE